MLPYPLLGIASHGQTLSGGTHNIVIRQRDREILEIPTDMDGILE